MLLAATSKQCVCQFRHLGSGRRIISAAAGLSRAAYFFMQQLPPIEQEALPALSIEQHLSIFLHESPQQAIELMLIAWS